MTRSSSERQRHPYPRKRPVSRIPDRRTAELGETAAPSLQIEGVARTVMAWSDACAVGRWVCISCGVVLEHNLAKDLHCGLPRPRKAAVEAGGPNGGTGARARHVLAWLNLGNNRLEVP